MTARRCPRASATLVLLLALAGAAPAPPADARPAGRAWAIEAVEEGGGEPGDGTERWWGVAGAMVCGIEARLILRAPAIGMNPYALAAGIAGCSLAAIDVLTTK